MKKLILLSVIMLLSIITFAQNSSPICNPDTVYGNLHEVITVDVLANNTDAEGDSMSVFFSGNGFTGGSNLTIDLGAGYFYGKSGWIEEIYFIKTFDSSGQAHSPVNWGRDTLRIFLTNPSFDYLDINSITARINACGDNFWDLQGKKEFYTNNDTLKGTIFNSNLLIGGKNSDSLYFSGKFYYSIDSAQFRPGPISNTYDNAYDIQWDKVWKLNLEEIRYHQHHYSDANYTAPQNILDWPGNGDMSLGQSAQLAPYKDINGNGIYEPMQGDYPLIRGDQAIFYIYNDERASTKVLSDYKHLGVEVKAMAYSFDAPNDSVLNNTVFMHYDIVNKSTLNYDSAYFGIFTDLDIGYHLDDYIASDVANGAFYSYNGTAVDGNGLSSHYGVKPPAMAVQFLAGPEKDSDGIDNPSLDSNNQQLCDESLVGWGYGNGIVDDERLGMSNFMSIGFPTSGFPPYFAPSNAEEHYYFLEGRFANGLHLLYGGNGALSNGAFGPECRYMFPGNSDTCNYGLGGLSPYGPTYWSEPTTGNQPHDRKGLASSGPFTFQSGESKQLDIAYVYARGDTMSIPKLKRRLGELRSDFLNDTTSFNLYTDIENLESDKNLEAKIYPNPTKDIINIEFSNIPYENVQISLFSLNQQLIKSDNCKNKSYKLSISDLPKGMYIIHIQYEGETFVHKIIKM